MAHLAKGEFAAAYWYTIDPNVRSPASLPANPDSDPNFRRELEMRLKLVEGEVRGQIDLSQFGKPDLLSGPKDDE